MIQKKLRRYSSDENVLQQLANANNTRNRNVYKTLVSCLEDDYIRKMPNGFLPYDDVTVDELRDLLDLNIETRMKDIPKTRWWRIWK